MSDDPLENLPPIPAIGEILDRKKRFVEKKHSVLKCGSCHADFAREFKAGDFVFKKLNDEECEKCHQSKALTIIEIYSEWVDPKKSKD